VEQGAFHRDLWAEVGGCSHRSCVPEVSPERAAFLPLSRLMILPKQRDLRLQEPDLGEEGMDSTILAETQAFITRQREALLQQREAIFNQQQELQRQLDEVNEMLGKFDVFEGKSGPGRQQSRTRRASGTRRSSKREELLKVIREGNGLTRGQILEKMGLKGDKAGEMSVSNALTALTKSQQVARRDGKYVVA
jgi:hypothetical protein